MNKLAFYIGLTKQAVGSVADGLAGLDRLLNGNSYRQGVSGINSYSPNEVNQVQSLFPNVSIESLGRIRNYQGDVNYTNPKSEPIMSSYKNSQGDPLPFHNSAGQPITDRGLINKSLTGPKVNPVNLNPTPRLEEIDPTRENGFNSQIDKYKTYLDKQPPKVTLNGDPINDTIDGLPLAGPTPPNISKLYDSNIAEADKLKMTDNNTDKWKMPTTPSPTTAASTSNVVTTPNPIQPTQQTSAGQSVTPSVLPTAQTTSINQPSIANIPAPAAGTTRPPTLAPTLPAPKPNSFKPMSGGKGAFNLMNMNQRTFKPPTG